MRTGLHALRPSFALFVFGEALRPPDDAHGLLRAPVADPGRRPFRARRARRSSWHSGLAALAPRLTVSQWMAFARAPGRAALSRASHGSASGAPGAYYGSTRATMWVAHVGGRSGEGLGRSVRPSGPPLTIACADVGSRARRSARSPCASGTAARGGHRAQAAGARARARGRHGGRLLGARRAHHRRRLARAEDAAAAARLEQGERHRGHGHARGARLRVAAPRIGGPPRGRRRPRADRPLAGRAALPGSLRARQSGVRALDENEKRTFSELCRKLPPRAPRRGGDGPPASARTRACSARWARGSPSSRDDIPAATLSERPRATWPSAVRAQQRGCNRHAAGACGGLGLRHDHDLLDAAAVDVALEPLGGLDGRRAERRDSVVAGHRHRLAVLEHRRRRADLADRVDEPADHVERGLAAAEHEGGRVERADGAHDALRREVEGEQQRAEAGAAQAQLERLHVQRLDVEPRARVEQEHALRAARRRHHAPGCVQPAGGPAAARARARPRGPRARRPARARAGAPPRPCAPRSGRRGSPP